jgi:hypothetical protein
VIPKIQANLDQLNSLMAAWVVFARKTPAEALAKHGTNLGYYLAEEFSQFTPGKGAITTERLSALKAGGGVKVRPEVRAKVYEKLGVFSPLAENQSVAFGNQHGSQFVLAGGKKNSLRFGKLGRKSGKIKGKRLNLQARVVQAELAVRERGRNFLPFVAKIKGLNQLGAASDNAKSVFHRGRYNQLVASAGFEPVSDGASLLFVYGSASSSGGTAMAKPRQQAATVSALEKTSVNIGVYLARKFSEMGVSA